MKRPCKKLRTLRQNMRQILGKKNEKDQEYNPEYQGKTPDPEGPQKTGRS